MKFVPLVAASMALLPFAAVQAQTLEQSFAEQCSSGQNSESCDVLRKALLEKLQSQQASAAQDQATTVLRQAPSEALAYELTDEQKARWGLLANLAGKHWLDNDGHISTYEWLEVGERLKLEVEKSTGEKTVQHFRPSDEQAGELAWSIHIPERGGMVRLGQVTVFHDGAIYWRPGNVLWEMAQAGMTTASKAKIRKDRTYAKSGGIRGTTHQISHVEFEQWIAARDERLRQEALARNNRSGDDSNLMAAALGGFMKGWSEGIADNDRMRRTLDDATARGLAEGNAIRRQREAEEARRQGELAGDQADWRRAGAENGGLSREQAGRGPSSTNGQLGLTIADRREPAAASRAPAEPETRQTYAWCMALRPNQNVTYSTVQQITIPNHGWSDSSMAQDFGAVAGGGVSVCSNTDSRAAAQAQLDSSKTQHRGITQTTTSAILRP